MLVPPLLVLPVPPLPLLVLPPHVMWCGSTFLVSTYSSSSTLPALSDGRHCSAAERCGAGQQGPSAVRCIKVLC